MPDRCGLPGRFTIYRRGSGRGFAAAPSLTLPRYPNGPLWLPSPLAPPLPHILVFTRKTPHLDGAAVAAPVGPYSTSSGGVDDDNSGCEPRSMGPDHAVVLELDHPNSQARHNSECAVHPSGYLLRTATLSLGYPGHAREYSESEQTTAIQAPIRTPAPLSAGVLATCPEHQERCKKFVDPLYILSMLNIDAATFFLAWGVLSDRPRRSQRGSKTSVPR